MAEVRELEFTIGHTHLDVCGDERKLNILSTCKNDPAGVTHL